MKTKLIIASAFALLPYETWAGCGPPQCPVISHEITKVATTQETCVTVGLHPNESLRTWGGLEATIFDGNGEKIGETAYDVKSGICTYDYYHWNR